MISIQSDTDTVRVTVDGDLDDVNAPQFEALFRRMAPLDQSTVVDLIDCTYINTTGISLLSRIIRKSDKRVTIIVAETGIVKTVLEFCCFPLSMTDSRPRSA